MAVNLVNVYGLVTAIISVVILLQLVPQQFREFKRPQDGFSMLRKRLLLQLVLGLILITPRIPYFWQGVTAPHRGWGYAVVSMATSTLLFMFIYNMLLSYTYKER